ncbi:unnamed protein product [marine sediment metagenome]|uniref:Uncharacterized protein n=1 Tax=marine sediment metagenome TaxID=412755 RepID=X1HP78_9ZZZZ
MAKTIEEINEKIKSRKVVVLNAEEIIDYVNSYCCYLFGDYFFGFFILRQF